jgi:hypothetical protein
MCYIDVLPLYELIYMALMHLFCVALIISIVYLCPMLLYKISKSHVIFFDNFRLFSLYFTTVVWEQNRSIYR